MICGLNTDKQLRIQQVSEEWVGSRSRDEMSSRSLGLQRQLKSIKSLRFKKKVVQVSAAIQQYVRCGVIVVCQLKGN